MKQIRFDELCNSIAAKLIASIEAGEGTGWEVPWRNAGTLVTPINASTAKQYQAGNWIIAVLTAAENGWESGRWATYKQWTGLGRQVAKGQKGTQMVKWVESKRDTEEDTDPKAKEPGLRKASRRMFPSMFTVFAAEQLTNDPAAKWQVPTPKIADSLKLSGRDCVLDEWISATQATIHHDATSAYYNILTDDIHLPELDAWDDWGDYYSTKVHELVHWTGHKSRLDRPVVNGSNQTQQGRAFEELVAELGAAMIGGMFNFSPTQRADHLGYLQHWADLLSADSKLLWKAASQAQKAKNFLADQTQTAVAPAAEGIGTIEKMAA